MDKNEPSFGHLVWARAWWSSWSPFRDRRLDIVLGLISLIVLAVRKSNTPEFPQSLDDWSADIVSVLAPFVIVWFILFVWHFWLAPAALAYEAAKEAARVRTDLPVLTYQEQKTEAKPEPRKPDYAIWKQRSSYNVNEFAALLDNSDPSERPLTPNARAYKRLLLEAVQNKKISYTPEYGLNEWDGRRYEMSVNEFTQIPRAVALSWAESKSFDVSRLK